MNRDELIVTAEIARLKLSEKEIDMLEKAVAQMLEYFSMIDEYDVETLEPTSHVYYRGNRLRDDSVLQLQDRDRYLQNAPEAEDEFIVIPNVL